MTEHEIERLVACEERGKSNSHRIDKLEEDHKALNELAIGVTVMGNEIKAMNSKITAIDNKVTKIEQIPGESYKKLIGYIVGALCSAGVGALITFLFS